MEDKRVSYATALLAKEKGFNVFCEWVVDEDDAEEFCYSEWEPNNYEYIYDQEHDNELFAYKKRCGSLINQPTQSLLQRWLREEHDIEVYVINSYPTFNIREKKWIVFVEPKGCLDGHYDSYEQALEKGLQEGLKLLKDEQ